MRLYILQKQFGLKWVKGWCVCPTGYLQGVVGVGLGWVVGGCGG